MRSMIYPLSSKISIYLANPPECNKKLIISGEQLK